MLRFHYISVLFLLCISCNFSQFTREIEVENIHFEPTLITKVDYEMGSPQFTVYATHTTQLLRFDFSFGSIPIDLIPKINFSYRLRDDQGLIIAENACEQCYFITDEIPSDLIQPQKTYTIEIVDDRFGQTTATAHSVAAVEVNVNRIAFDNNAFEVDLDFKKSSGYTDYFGFSISGQQVDENLDTLYYGSNLTTQRAPEHFENPLGIQNGYVIFGPEKDDEVQNLKLFGNIHSFYDFKPNSDTLHAALTLHQFSRDYYKYFRSLDQIEILEDLPFTEPVSVFTNFDNSIGIFSIRRRSYIPFSTPVHN